MASLAGATAGLWTAEPELEPPEEVVGSEAPEVMDERERVERGGETMRS